MSEEKKKMNYYYGGKEKSAREVKKKSDEITPYTTRGIQRDFDRLMRRFQRDFDDFWETPSLLISEMGRRGSMIPFLESTLPSVDLEDQGKMYRLTVDLPGFKKEDVQVELEEDAVTINAKRSESSDEKTKNYVHRERSSQTFYRKIGLPEEVLSDEAKASLNNGLLEVVLPKKQPKETKKLPIT